MVDSEGVEPSQTYFYADALQASELTSAQTIQN